MMTIRCWSQRKGKLAIFEVIFWKFIQISIDPL